MRRQYRLGLVPATDISEPRCSQGDSKRRKFYQPISDGFL